MEIIETTAFTRQISDLLTDDKYAPLQGLLAIRRTWEISYLVLGGSESYAGQPKVEGKAAAFASSTTG